MTKTVLKTVGMATLVLALAACTSARMATPTGQATLPPPTTVTTLPTLPPQPPAQPSPPVIQASLPAGNYAFIDSAALGSLNDAARSAARDAQFYALQFGRPGAPRNWSAGGASGQVSVGPYVRVNALDCREFTHRVTVAGQTYSRSGTACREADGTWDVVQA